jgi:DNA-binding NarL/FixJ family response regulator
MAVADAPHGADSPEALGRSTAIAIADDATILKRISLVIGEQGPRPLTEFRDPSAMSELDPDESTIVVFACDSDSPRDMAALRRLRREAGKPAIIVISPPATGAGVRRVLDAGADALVFEPDLESTLATTVSAVASGQSVVPRKLRASVERPTLSHREHQVLALVRQGLTNSEIATRLFLAESTIKSHLASVFTKFGVHSRTEAAAVFVELDLAADAVVDTVDPVERQEIA